MSIDSTFDTPERFDNDSYKSPETLEREIDAQRSSIGNIVDALEGKFSPGQLLDQALSYGKGTGGEFFSNLGNTVKTNPLPTVLTSVGLLWLMMGQNRSPSTSSGPSSLTPLGERISDMAHSVTDTFDSAKSRIGETAQRMKEKAGQVSDDVSGKLSATGERLNKGSHDATDSLREQSRKAQSSLTYMLREQPLALAAIGIALGAALGAALPSTERENQMMGQASDTLTEKVKQTASEGYEKVAQEAKGVVDEVKSASPDSTAQQGSTVDMSSGLG
ncbi:DUF3618 domain-containing protein [Pseudomonas sp. ICMP 561]|uniref:DUF3618 domain-containing protein n=1 Tax=Pseudomonas sp. ICMP 561 TaxID=1718918 RepID=UPI000C06E57E|nr:DUF3618 domain-containing protein [Pseudomonas sp. ICMP 561]PHN27549.1 hypothetical protein AO242_27950 [Pseudomonas sp. ICMP 561]